MLSAIEPSSVLSCVTIGPTVLVETAKDYLRDLEASICCPKRVLGYKDMGLTKWRDRDICTHIAVCIDYGIFQLKNLCEEGLGSATTSSTNLLFTLVPFLGQLSNLSDRRSEKVDLQHKGAGGS